MIMKKTFVLRAKITGKNVPIFLEGEEPGVIAVEEIEYDLPEERYSMPLFLMDLHRRQQELIESVITTTAVEVK